MHTVTVTRYQNVDGLLDSLQWRKYVLLKNKIYLDLKLRNIACAAK